MQVRFDIPGFEKKQPPQPVETKTRAKGDCSDKQALINKLVEVAKQSQNKAIMKALNYVKQLGVVPGIAASEEFAKQAICTRRAGAINQFRQVRTQLKEIDSILTAHKL